MATFGDPEWMKAAMTGWAAMFSYGQGGYTDDRLADGPGWESFDAAAIRCPVVVLHGGSDPIVDVSHARHTAAIVPGARLVVFEELGHFSIESKVVPTVTDLLEESSRLGT